MPRATIVVSYIVYALTSCVLIFVDWKPSAKVYTCESLDRALVQWQNMAIREYRNTKIQDP